MACGEHWGKAMERLTSDFMKDPAIFISSFMEVAIYGQMKVDVRRGTCEEMDAALLEIVNLKRTTPTMIFCRDAKEIRKVRGMLSEQVMFSLELCTKNI